MVSEAASEVVKTAPRAVKRSSVSVVIVVMAPATVDVYPELEMTADYHSSAHNISYYAKYRVGVSIPWHRDQSRE